MTMEQHLLERLLTGDDEVSVADQKWTFLFYFAEDGSALVACARLQRWVERSSLEESGRAAPHPTCAGERRACPRPGPVTALHSPCFSVRSGTDVTRPRAAVRPSCESASACARPDSQMPSSEARALVGMPDGFRFYDLRHTGTPSRPGPGPHSRTRWSAPGSPRRGRADLSDTRTSIGSRKLRAGSISSCGSPARRTRRGLLVRCLARSRPQIRPGSMTLAFRMERVTGIEPAL
ncbi:UNVERIFIED_CONTAM: hypothetical protein RKD43_003585 [Streptomyces graminofaciens]